MLNRKDLEALNPDLTPELMTKVDEIIDRYRDKPGCLIPVLEECQETVGYLPVELQEYTPPSPDILPGRGSGTPVYPDIGP